MDTCAIIIGSVLGGVCFLGGCLCYCTDKSARRVTPNHAKNVSPPEYEEPPLYTQ